MTGHRPRRDPLRPGAMRAEQHAAPRQALELALRYGMRYSGLRDIELDPRLLAYVPLDICERERVVPFAVGDVLEIATAYPDPDLELVVQRFPALEIELVLAPAGRIDELHAELKDGLR